MTKLHCAGAILPRHRQDVWQDVFFVCCHGATGQRVNPVGGREIQACVTAKRR